MNQRLERARKEKEEYLAQKEELEQSIASLQSSQQAMEKAALELSEQIAKEGMKFTIECMRGDTACKILANLTCIYEKRKEIELEMRYLKDAYYLSRLYRQGMLTDLLKNRYAEKQINFQANRLNLQIFISETN